MRLLSARLIISLIIGVTIVSLCSSYYQSYVLARGLRKDLDRRAQVLGKALPATWNATWAEMPHGRCKEPCSSSRTANIWRALLSMILRATPLR